MNVFERYIDVLTERCKDDDLKFNRLVMKLAEWQKVEEERQKEAQQS